MHSDQPSHLGHFPQPLVLLGFDFGMKHIGIAVGQSISRSASALCTLSAQDGIPQWPEIQALINQWQPTQLIVGLPLNMDGTEQPITQATRRFIQRLQQKFQLPVFEVDERLSTWEAEHLVQAQKNRLRSQNQKRPGIQSQNKNYKQSQKTHAYSAVILLEQWMQEHYVRSNTEPPSE